MKENNEETRLLFDLISRLLEYEPEKRIRLDEALDHPFFAALEPDQLLHVFQPIPQSAAPHRTRSRSRSPTPSSSSASAKSRRSRSRERSRSWKSSSYHRDGRRSRTRSSSFVRTLYRNRPRERAPERDFFGGEGAFGPLPRYEYSAAAKSWAEERAALYAEQYGWPSLPMVFGGPPPDWRYYQPAGAAAASAMSSAGTTSYGGYGPGPGPGPGDFTPVARWPPGSRLPPAADYGPLWMN